MRWERLFADLEARLEAAEHELTEGDVADLTRSERGQLQLRDRLRAHVGETLSWSVGVDESPLSGELMDVGADWVLIRGSREELLIPIAAVQHVSGLSRAAEPAVGEVARRLGIAVVLRGLVRDRAIVTVRLASDQRLTGTIDRVGKDHLDLAIHGADLPRRATAVLAVRCVLLHAVVGVAVQ